MRRMLLAILAAGLLFAIPAAAPARDVSAPPKQPTAVGTGGGAATVDPLATQAAIDTLRHGGNAIDAAVAAAGVLGVVEPYSCGIGGGGFMTIYSARDGKVHTIDSRETAPAAMTPTGTATSFEGLTDFEHQRVSGMSVGVPGTLRAWDTALREFGTTSLRDALKPGIETAKRGFVVDPTFFAQTDAAKAIFADFPSTAALYLDPDGTPRDVGTVIRNPDLARTYKLIARQGPGALYGGPLAQAIVNTVQHPPLRPGSTRVARPGVMTLDDLARYRTVDRAPTAISYRGLDVFGMAPALERRVDRRRGAQHPRGLHRPRHRAARPRHPPLPRGLALQLRRPRQVHRRPRLRQRPARGPAVRRLRRAAARADRPTPRATSPVAPGTPPGAPGGVADNSASAVRVGSTTNMTVSDRFGNVVEYTFTIEQTGGNGMVVPGYGFLLNNELTDFNLDPDGTSPASANQIAGGKRPRSSIAPTIVLRDGQAVPRHRLARRRDDHHDRPADPHEPPRPRHDPAGGDRGAAREPAQHGQDGRRAGVPRPDRSRRQAAGPRASVQPAGRDRRGDGDRVPRRRARARRRRAGAARRRERDGGERPRRRPRLISR